MRSEQDVLEGICNDDGYFQAVSERDRFRGHSSHHLNSFPVCPSGSFQLDPFWIEQDLAVAKNVKIVLCHDQL